MTFEPILLKLAELVEASLPAGSAFVGRVTPNVADPKDLDGNTWCVVEMSGGARELVAGNFTMQGRASVEAVLVPTEGPWGAESIRAQFEGLWQAVQAAAEALPGVEFDACRVLHVQVAPVEVRAVRAVGYSGEVQVTLVVQF